MSDFPLPPDLPEPRADGACDHLEGLALPSVTLPATTGGEVDLSRSKGWTVVYAYPATGVPGEPLPAGWNEIPGARGCTPQSCSFRDHHAELVQLGVGLYGLSAQPTAVQIEAAERLRLPFPLLSDAEFRFADALRLPTFRAGNDRFLKRVTLVIQAGKVEKVFYPVFPPDQNPADVVAWFEARSARTPEK